MCTALAFSTCYTHGKGAIIMGREREREREKGGGRERKGDRMERHCLHGSATY